MADTSQDNGALHSSSDASNPLPQVVAPVRAVYLADEHHKRSLLLKYCRKWRAFHRKRRAQWKQNLLATHHAHFARLWSAFDGWRQRTSTARKRKQQIEAACAVGAGFFQRLFFRRWRAYVAQRKLGQRLQALRLLAEKAKHVRVIVRLVVFSVESPFVLCIAHGMVFCVQRVLSRYFARWKALQRKSTKKHSLVNQTRHSKGRASVRPHFSRHLRVQGSALLRGTSTSAPGLKLRIAPQESQEPTTAAANLKSAALRRLIESRSKRHFFKVVSRWKKRVSAARERALLEECAYFFLYFCLTKKSLTQLKEYAGLRKRKHVVKSMAERGIKARVLRKLVVLSSQRRCIRRVFVAWHDHTFTRQQTEKPEIQSTKLLVYNRYRSRLLQEAFGSWRDRFTQKQVYASVIRIAQQYRTRAIGLAWSRWQQLVVQMSRIQQWDGNRRVRTLHKVWGPWKLRAQRTRRNELNRRLAVRFSYRRLLRKGFASFLIAVQQAHEVAENAEIMRHERFKSVLVSCIAGWKALATDKHLQARKRADAASFYDTRLVNRVWKLGWRRFVTSRASRRAKLEIAAEHYGAGLQQKAFQGWKEVWADRRRREELLGIKAANHVESRNRQRTERVLQLWLEYVRKRQTSRLVSAHARGQWQVKVLRESFADWMTRTSERRWEQIQDQRARQHRDAKLKQKCFQCWKRKLAALKQYRAQNRKALIHWKLAVEKKAFTALKAYVSRKKRERARMHDALEFRHRLIVSEGVRHWMTASLHLQAQRENHASQSQAQHAARVWRTVARIARHWRTLAVNRRVVRSGGFQANASNYRRSNAPRSPESWLGGHECKRTGQHRAPPIPVGKESRDTQNGFRVNSTNAVAATGRSALSEFVTLPKNRPQPRRPIDLLVVSAAVGDLREDPAPDTTTATGHNVEAGDLHTKYGFEFPAQPFQPLMHEPRTPLKKIPVDKPQVPRRPPPPAHRPAQRPALSQLDALEAQLHVWKTRKQELKALQVKIENSRRQLQDSSAQRYTSPSVTRQMQVELFTMEKQYDEFSSKWLTSKERIRAVSQEILRLYAALQQA